MSLRHHQWLYYSALIIGAPIIGIIALGFGSSEITVVDLIRSVFEERSATLNSTILHLRIPRVLGAFAVGGSLGLAGALMQVLVRNPLADPYVLGVSGGASLATLIAILAGVSGTLMHGAAFGGALAAMLLVFVVAHGREAWSPVRLLLSGVMLATAWTAAISLTLTIAPEAQLRGMLFWLMGDLSYVESTRWLWIVLCLGLSFALFFARELNLIGQGTLQAAALGVDIKRTQRVIYVGASLLAAASVTTAGALGFVGLAAPHIARLAFGTDHRISLLASVFIGGNLVVIADTIARTVVAPVQIPVGVITALIGIPVFLHLLRRGRL